MTTEETIDELVRDLTSVAPRPKSEVRARIQQLLEAQKWDLLKKLTLKSKDWDRVKVTYRNHTMTDMWSEGYGVAIRDLEALKATLLQPTSIITATEHPNGIDYAETPIEGKDLKYHAGKYHYSSCSFPEVDEAVCNCPGNLKSLGVRG